MHRGAGSRGCPCAGHDEAAVTVVLWRGCVVHPAVGTSLATTRTGMIPPAGMKLGDVGTRNRVRTVRNLPLDGPGMPGDAAEALGKGCRIRGGAGPLRMPSPSLTPRRFWSLPVPAPQPILSLLKHCTAFSRLCFPYPTPSTRIAITPLPPCRLTQAASSTAARTSASHLARSDPFHFTPQE